MKYLLCLCFLAVLCLPLFSAKLTIDSLDSPAHPDLEVNKCVDIPDSCYTEIRTLTLEITFNNASPSNGFYVAFGNDTGNDYLECCEMAFQIGFDQGVWKFREKGMVKTYVCTNSFAQTGTKSLRMKIRVTEDKNPLWVTFEDNGHSFTFPGLDLSSKESIPAYFTPPFTDLKVTRRGPFTGDPEDSTSLILSKDGIVIILR